MKNKKGFTLTELLAVIAILAILITIGLVSYINIRNNILKKDYDNLVSRIETEAANYAKDTGIVIVNVETLINEGYMQADDEDTIYDPRDNSSMNCYIVESIYENGVYTSTLTDNLTDGDTCQSYDIVKSLSICAYDEDNICQDFDNNLWQKGTLKLGVKSNSGEELPNNTTYIWSSTNGQTGNLSSINVNSSSILQDTYKVQVTYQNDDDETVKGEATKAIKIDNQSPVIINYEVESGWTMDDKKVIVTASDENGSGLVGIYFEDITNNCSTDKSNYKLTSTNSLEKNLDSGMYRICAMDNVGNITNSNANNGTNIIIDKIYTEDDILYLTLKPNNYYPSLPEEKLECFMKRELNENYCFVTLSELNNNIIGYEILGYNDNINATIAKYNSGYEFELTKNNSNKILYKIIIPSIYTITLDKNNGSDGTNTIYEVYSEKYTLTKSLTAIAMSSSENKLTLPTKTGYTFDGYYTEDGIQYISKTGYLTSNANNKKFEADDKLIARWTANTYTVNFNANYGSVSPTSKSVTYDATYGDLPTPTRTGYTFSGWYTAQSGGNQVSSNTKVTITAPQTLYARWTANNYTINYNLNNGSYGTYHPASGTYDSVVTISNPIRTGYTFAGWTVTSGLNTNTAKYGATSTTVTTSLASSSTKVTTQYFKNLTADYNGSVMLTVNWTPTNYNITYTLNGGVASNPATYNIETNTFTLNNPTRTGYTFTGWSGTGLSGSANKTVTIPKGSTGDKSYTANWSANPYTITLNKQSGSGGSSSVTATYGSSMPSINVPSRSDYTFGGYYTGTNGSGTQYYTSSGTSARNWDIAANTTLYANWIPNYTTVTIYFAKGTGISSLTKTSATCYIYTGSSSCTIVPAYGTASSGYTVGGWYTAKTGGSFYGSSDFDTWTVYAYQDGNTYYLRGIQKTVTIYFAKGTGISSLTKTSATCTITSGSSCQIVPAYGTASSGYTVGGWYTAKTGGSFYGSSDFDTWTVYDTQDGNTYYLRGIQSSLDTINDYRYARTTCTCYYITTCDDSYCSYTKRNGSSISGSVSRNNLGSKISTCTYTC